MLKKSLFLFLGLLLVLPLLGLPVVAQDATATPEPTEIPAYCPSFTTASTAERTSYYMGEGAAFLRSANYDAAINAYSCVIQQIDSSYVNAYLNRAVAYTARREYEEALQDYDAALRLNSNNEDAFNNRGVLYTATQEYELAMADFDQAISLDGDYAYAYINRGVLKAINGDLDGAEADCMAAIEAAGLEPVIANLTDPERDPDEPRPEYDPRAAQAYALLGTIHSARALEAYNNYLLLTGGRADERVQSAAGSLESRFEFELRFDDGSWMLLASFDQQ